MCTAFDTPPSIPLLTPFVTLRNVCFAPSFNNVSACVSDSASPQIALCTVSPTVVRTHDSQVSSLSSWIVLWQEVAACLCVRIVADSCTLDPNPLPRELSLVEGVLCVWRTSERQHPLRRLFTKRKREERVETSSSFCCAKLALPTRELVLHRCPR